MKFFKFIGEKIEMEIELLTDVEMSKIFKVEKQTIITWVNRGKIPKNAIFKLPGTKKGTIRFIKAKIEDWINGCLQT